MMFAAFLLGRRIGRYPLFINEGEAFGEIAALDVGVAETICERVAQVSRQFSADRAVIAGGGIDFQDSECGLVCHVCISFGASRRVGNSLVVDKEEIKTILEISL